MPYPQRYDLVVPDLAMGDVPLRLSLWLVRRGAKVTGGEVVAELLAGPATFDLAAPATGVLSEKCVREDQPVSVGQRLGTIVAGEE